MCRLLESIKLENGKFQRVFYHEERMRKSLKALFGSTQQINLEQFLINTIHPVEGIYKCRVLYDEVSRRVEFVPYQFKEVKTLMTVDGDDIDYEFKYADRTSMDKLYQLRASCDDVLIIKHGLVTDTSYANIVFRKGKTWFTPSSPLLKGTMRTYLLEQDLIEEAKIAREAIKYFEGFKLINAMLGFGSPEYGIPNIIF